MYFMCFQGELLRRYLNCRRALVCLAVFTFPVFGSALSPLTLDQSGQFGLDRGAYQLKVELNADNYRLSHFELYVDQKKIPIGVVSFSHIAHLRLSSVNASLGRGEWLVAENGETLIPGFGVLTLSFGAASEDCAQSDAVVEITVNTFEEYAWAVSSYCRDVE
ncbi:MAG: hypothetical protein AAF465_04285 [Pseudomonadota bacterium]